MMVLISLPPFSKVDSWITVGSRRSAFRIDFPRIGDLGSPAGSVPVVVRLDAGESATSGPGPGSGDENSLDERD
jgi:hypothetical protein